MNSLIEVAASNMLEELEGGGLEVIKIPSNQGGYIRVPISVNAEWYRQFCAEYVSRRRRYPRPRTIIKRCHTIAALKRIITGKRRGVYAERLMPFIEEYMEYMELNTIPQHAELCVHEEYSCSAF